MPTLAIIDGVKIMIYPGDHVPPHFHAVLAEHEALISIATGNVLKGGLPAAKLRKVQRWFTAHQEQMAFFWVEIQNGRNPGGFI